MAYSPKDYWRTLAKDYDSADVSGFAPVLHPKTPIWFNQIIDNLQFRALRRALAIAQIAPGARLLDVGCGTGRWIRRYRELGFSATGIDATFEMLRIARVHETRDPLVVGLAYCLPFSDSQFDGLSDITVVQHIPYGLQSGALREMLRVLRPGGQLILLELIRGRGPHIFPRPVTAWISEVESCGATLVDYFGQEFRFPDRVFVRLAQMFAARRNDDDQGHSSSARSSSGMRRVYWQLRRISVSVSAWAEPLVAGLCPTSLATHAVFVFRKNR